MKNHQAKKTNLQSVIPDARPVFYEIKIQGQLDPQRSKWFEGMVVEVLQNEEGTQPCTLISGPVVDQPALHGLLTKIRDLNLTLISVRRSLPGTSPAEEVLTGPNPPGE